MPKMVPCVNYDHGVAFHRSGTAEAENCVPGGTPDSPVRQTPRPRTKKKGDGFWGTILSNLFIP